MRIFENNSKLFFTYFSLNFFKWNNIWNSSKGFSFWRFIMKYKMILNISLLLCLKFDCKHKMKGNLYYVLLNIYSEMQFSTQMSLKNNIRAKSVALFRTILSIFWDTKEYSKQNIVSNDSYNKNILKSNTILWQTVKLFVTLNSRIVFIRNYCYFLRKK